MTHNQDLMTPIIIFICTEILIFILALYLKPGLWSVIISQIFIVGVWLPLILKEIKGDTNE